MITSPTQASFLLVLAVRFCRAIVAWGLHGFRSVTNDTYRARLAICTGGAGRSGTGLSPPCEHFRRRLAVIPTCGHCGCALGLKAHLPSERCPINRWPQ